MSDSPGILRFGVFEVHLAAGELRKHGSRVKLQEQPFQVLATLAKRPGEIVTREELKEKLWTGDTFVDFDHSLSTAVNKIREALGDSATSPRFIETVPRKGYRFVGGAAIAQGDAAEVPSEAFASAIGGRWWAWGLAGFMLVALGAFAIPKWRDQSPQTRSVAAGPIPLTSLRGSEERPAFSPDGTRVAFSWNGETQENLDIYVQVVGAGDPLRLTSDSARETTPAWSPDGSQIAFERRSSAGRSIHLISPFGGSETRVADISDSSNGGPYPLGIAWAPDGKSIFYAEPGSAGAPAAIFRLFLETGARLRLTSPAPDMYSGDRYLQVSPDGRTLAFVRSTVHQAEIWVMSLESGESRKITSQGQLIMGLAWTPDGREIVYSQEGPLGGRLWRVAIVGGGPRLMPEVAGYGQFPTISRMGRRLAYEGADFDVNVWLYSLSGQESGQAALPVGASTLWDGDPRISPDGNQIAFVSTRGGTPQVWIYNRDGSGVRRLTSLSRGSGSPRWSPDGRGIAFDSAEQGSWDIYVVDPRGGAPRRLTTEEGLDARPSWSSDGLWIYFATDRTGSTRIWKAPVGGGEAVPVTKGPNDIQPFESPDGRFLYFCRQRQRSELWRMPVEGGDEIATGLTFPLAGNQAWDIAENGIYFVESRETPDFGTKRFLRLLRFDASEPVDVREVPSHLGTGATPLDISPDGKWFAYAQVDRVETDLMILENFE